MSSTSILLRPSISARSSATSFYVQNSVVYATDQHGTQRQRVLPRRMESSPAKIQECWVVNLPQPKKVTVYLKVANATARSIHGYVRLLVLDPVDGRILHTERRKLGLAPNEQREVRCVVEVESTVNWTLDNQVLYTLNASWHTQGSLHLLEMSKLEFAFCNFPSEGTGRDSMFRGLNRSVRLGAVMSWGCWGIDGLRPIGDLTQSRVRI